MGEWLKTNFKTIWWVVMLGLFSFMTAGIWWPVLKGKDIPSMNTGSIILFLIWTALLFWPIIKEINLFGLSLKKEIDSVKSEVREIRVTVNLNTPPYTDQVFTSEQILRQPLRPPPPTTKLSDDALKVLSTLYKHQMQYSPQIWRFAVGPRNSNYEIYSKGVSETNRLGLTGSWPEDGMTYLTPAGLAYCKVNENNLPKDWDYQRWQKSDVTPS